MFGSYCLVRKKKQKILTNNKQTAVDFIYDELKKYVRYDNRNAVETFDRIFEQAKERYNDEIESSIIEICSEKSTSEASSYEHGYKEGYKRALELSQWALSNLMPPYNDSIKTYN